MNIIIVGASSGIGEKLAKDFATQGHTIGITGRRKSLLQNIKSQFPHQIKIKDFDISDIEDCTRHLEELTHELGGLDLLILSAGIGKESQIIDFGIEYEVIQTNVVGWTAIADWAINYFISRGRGHFVGITSIASLRGAPFSPSYSASKAYQSIYLESLRLHVDTKKIPIKVLEVQPGFMETDMAQGNLFRVCSLPKASRQIRQAIIAGKKHIYLSKRRKVFAWLMTILPYRIYKKVVNSM